MNKELIKKYKAEFDHWLNGGKILMHYDKWVPVTLDAKWDFSMSYLEKIGSFGYIIDDKYVEFRKALAEGKKIEVLDLDGKWKDTGMTSSNRDFIYPLEEYRIKPEVHKFKAGDWVVHNGVIKQVTKAVDGLIDSLDNQVAVIMKDESLELWKPKPGEWCIMYDKDENPNATYIALQRWNDKCKWIPIPFIGKLPPYIKDSDES